jgi:DNA-binding MarR family transcriptional regulator
MAADQEAGVQAARTAVADSVLDLVRAVRKSKARMMADGRDDVESATYAVLQVVAAGGPMRASALAGCVHSDLSTVSRQAAGLVADGLLERRADPVDGRASLLALTEAGEAAVAAREAGRVRFFARVLDGWTEGDMRQFASMLSQFTVSYDQVHAAVIADRARPGEPGERRRPRPVTPSATERQQA